MLQTEHPAGAKRKPNRETLIEEIFMRGISLLGLALVFILGALGCSSNEPEEKPNVQKRIESQKEKQKQSYMTE